MKKNGLTHKMIFTVRKNNFGIRHKHEMNWWKKEYAMRSNQDFLRKLVVPSRSSHTTIRMTWMTKNTLLSLTVGKRTIVNPQDSNSSHPFILKTFYCLIHHIRCNFTTQVCDCSRLLDMFYYFRNKTANTIDDVVLTAYLPSL